MFVLDYALKIKYLCDPLTSNFTIHDDEICENMSRRLAQRLDAFQCCVANQYQTQH